jgi:hypothetical protein
MFAALAANWLLCEPSCLAQVYLNEICADNGGAAVSPGGTSPDYIELYNTNAAAVNLSTWTLTDDATAPTKYQFPSGTMIPGKGYVVVWLEPTAVAYAGLVTTNFSLKSSGEEVVLFQGSTVKDRLKFGPQIKDTALLRVPNGTGAWKLGSPSPLATNVVLAPTLYGTNTALRLNEWLATNSAGANFDWLELYNPKTNGIVSLGGLVFSDLTTAVTTTAVISNSFIGAGEFIRFWCDGTTNGGNHLEFKISSTLGETLTLYQSNRTSIIDRVSFGPQAVDVSQGRLPDGGVQIFSFVGTNALTPGAANYFKPLTNVVINEVLTHTDPPLEDALELYNPTAAPLDLSYWWISNDEALPLKFQIPAGTIIPAGGYKVFYEQNQSNAVSATPGFNRSGTGNLPDFTFNAARGDFAVLTEGMSNGTLTGFRLSKDFGGADNGVSFGRYVKSTGGTDLVPMTTRTFGVDTPGTITQFRSGTGLTNAYPLVGPLVISEILYQPPPLISGGVTNDNTLDEFIELTSLTNGTLRLYDLAYPTNRWRLTGAVDYTFPTNTSLTATGLVVVVSFDPKTNLTQLATFRATYNLATNIPVFGPYAGRLGNLSETLQLEKPDAVQLPPHPDAGFVPYVLVEKVSYQTANGWPATAAGSGNSIQRQRLTQYANDPINWIAAAPTAGRSNRILIAPIITALQTGTPTQITLNSIPGVSYVLESEPSLSSSNWTAITPMTTSPGTNLTLSDPNALGGQRFYRVRAQ